MSDLIEALAKYDDANRVAWYFPPWVHELAAAARNWHALAEQVDATRRVFDPAHSCDEGYKAGVDACVNGHTPGDGVLFIGARRRVSKWVPILDGESYE